MSQNGFRIRPMAGAPREQSSSAPLSFLRKKQSSSRIKALWEAFERWWRHKKKEGGWLAFLAKTIGLGALIFFLYLGYLWLTLPALDDPYRSILSASQSTVITDRKGTELYRVYGKEDRTIVPGDGIAKHLREAIVAIEDRRFFERGCVDIRSLARAALSQIAPSIFVRSGGSTLSRQLARNAFLTGEKRLSRKIKEAMLACELERIYDKETLLTLYLNWVPFGPNAYGVEQASRTYFNKSAKDLTLAESAVIASLPQRPSYFNPYGRHVRTTVSPAIEAKIIAGTITDAAKIPETEVDIGLLGGLSGTGSATLYVGGRTDQVLRNMVAEQFITQEEEKQALAELRTLVFTPSREDIRAAHFVLWTRDQAETLFEESSDDGLLEQGGLKIETTLDWDLQQIAEKTVADHRKTAETLYKAHNIALVALDRETREILAYVGNVSYGEDAKEGKIDMVQTPRQPGSSFKPFVYATAFGNGYSPATVLYDVKTKFGPDEPQNYGGDFWGLTNARKALGGSRNIPAIKAFFLAGGEEPILDLASSMGIPFPRTFKEEHMKAGDDYGWPLALGSGEAPLLQMTQGYATFADGGIFKPAIGIRKMTDRRGSLLPLPIDPDTEGTQVLDPRIAYQITSILSDPSVRPGDYWKNVLTIPGTAAAAKTGTSNKPCPDDERKKGTCRIKPWNVWTLGYTPSLVVGVWVGNATGEPMTETADGITVAAPIWKEFLTKAQAALAKERNASLPTAFTVPSGIVQPQISLLSGELPTDCTPVSLRRADVFLSEHAPTLPDPACVTLTVDKVTNLLASDNCPVSAREQRSFFLPRSILAERWPLWEKGVQDWAHGSSVGTGSNLPLPLAPTEQCDVRKTPGRLISPTVSLQTPGPNGSVSYPSFQPRIDYSVGSTIRELSYAIDGKKVAALTSRPFEGISIRVPRSIKKEGSHTLQVTLTDEYYNVATDQVTFTFSDDRGGPSIRLLSPQDGSILSSGSGTTIRAEADDSEGGVKYVEFYLDETLLTRKPNAPYILNYAIPAGEHTIRAVAYDLAGNETEDRIRVTVSE